NGAQALSNGGFSLPQQVAVGDMGLSAAGLTWGNPLLLDMMLAGLTSLLPGTVGFALTAAFTMVPRVWVINPLWASVYFSPVDPVWAFMASPFRNNPGAFLAVTAGIGWFSFKNDFTAIMPAVSQNNQGGFALAGW